MTSAASANTTGIRRCCDAASGGVVRTPRAIPTRRASSWQGIKPAYIARQMGHSPQVLYTVYARWIDDADKGGEASKLGAALGEFFPGISPQRGLDEADG